MLCTLLNAQTHKKLTHDMWNGVLNLMLQLTIQAFCLHLWIKFTSRDVKRYSLWWRFGSISCVVLLTFHHLTRTSIHIVKLAIVTDYSVCNHYRMEAFFFLRVLFLTCTAIIRPVATNWTIRPISLEQAFGKGGVSNIHLRHFLKDLVIKKM